MPSLSPQRFFLLPASPPPPSLPTAQCHDVHAAGTVSLRHPHLRPHLLRLRRSSLPHRRRHRAGVRHRRLRSHIPPAARVHRRERVRRPDLRRLRQRGPGSGDAGCGPLVALGVRNVLRPLDRDGADHRRGDVQPGRVLHQPHLARRLLRRLRCAPHRRLDARHLLGPGLLLPRTRQHTVDVRCANTRHR